MKKIKLKLKENIVWDMCKMVKQPETCITESRRKRTKHRTNFEEIMAKQWLRTRLPMQGTLVRALVREDPTCHGATKAVRHNY